MIDRGFFVYCGARAFVTARAALALPVRQFLRQLDRWLACRSFAEARRLLLELLTVPEVPGEPGAVPDVREL